MSMQMLEGNVVEKPIAKEASSASGDASSEEVQVRTYEKTIFVPLRRPFLMRNNAGNEDTVLLSGIFDVLVGGLHRGPPSPPLLLLPILFFIL